MLKQISLLCSGLLTSMAMTSITHAAVDNTITLQATVASVCSVSFKNTDNVIEWGLDPKQENSDLANDSKDVVIAFEGCVDGNATPIQLTSSNVSENECVEASKDGEVDAKMQFCFKDESDNPITVLEVAEAPQSKLKVAEALKSQLSQQRAEAVRTIKVYPQRAEEGVPLVEGTYRGFVTVVSNLN